MKYLDQGDMFILREDGRVLCEAVVLPSGDGECELMNLAVAEDIQRRGIGSEMVTLLMKRYAREHHSMLVGTSQSGVGFYQRLGFEPVFVRKDFFVNNYERPVVENGTVLRDMYCLRALLRP